MGKANAMLISKPVFNTYATTLRTALKESLKLAQAGITNPAVNDSTSSLVSPPASSTSASSVAVQKSSQSSKRFSLQLNGTNHNGKDESLPSKPLITSSEEDSKVAIKKHPRKSAPAVTLVEPEATTNLPRGHHDKNGISKKIRVKKPPIKPVAPPPTSAKAKNQVAQLVKKKLLKSSKLLKKAAAGKSTVKKTHPRAISPPDAKKRKLSPSKLSMKNDSKQKEPKPELPVYRKLRCNQFGATKPPWEFEAETCACARSDSATGKNLLRKSKCESGPSEKNWRAKDAIDCGDACLNRLIYVECVSSVCPCGELCRNQKIRRQESQVDALTLRYCGAGKGWGVFCKAPHVIAEGSYVVEYTGEVISAEEFQRRMRTDYIGQTHHYCLHLDQGWLIDAYASGSLARFVNHSCQPNCEMQKWLVNGCYRMCLFALRDIQPGEELSYDYNFCSFNRDTAQVCQCGAPQCRGVIGSKPAAGASVPLQERGLSYFFGRTLCRREMRFIQSRNVFLVRNFLEVRHLRLGGTPGTRERTLQRGSSFTNGVRNGAADSQFTNCMATFNTYRSIRTRCASTVHNDDGLSTRVRLGQVLRNLFQELLTAKEALPEGTVISLAEPFLKCPDPKRHWEFLTLVGEQYLVSLETIRSRLYVGAYISLEEFDADVLLMLRNYEMFAGRGSTWSLAVKKMRDFYAKKKEEYVGLYEVYTETALEANQRGVLLDCEKSTKLLCELHLRPWRRRAILPGPNGDTVREEPDSETSPNPVAPLYELVGDSSSPGQGAEVIRCPCGYRDTESEMMVQCDLCATWQHADCVNCVLLQTLGPNVSEGTVPCVSSWSVYRCPWCFTGTNWTQLLPCHQLLSTVPEDANISWEIPADFRPFHAPGEKKIHFISLLDPATGFLARVGEFFYFPRMLFPSLGELPSLETELEGVKEDSVSEASSIFSLAGDHKAPLLRCDLVLARVVDLWRDPHSGERFVQVSLFLRPYDVPEWTRTNCNAKQKFKQKKNGMKRSSLVGVSVSQFRPQEVVYCDASVTVPLSQHRGPCVVLNEDTYQAGRPRVGWGQYERGVSALHEGTLAERDVFVCRYKVNHDRTAPTALKDATFLERDRKPWNFIPFLSSSTDTHTGQMFTQKPVFHEVDDARFSWAELLRLDGEPDEGNWLELLNTKRRPEEVARSEKEKIDLQRRERMTNLASVVSRVQQVSQRVALGEESKEVKSYSVEGTPLAMNGTGKRQRKSLHPRSWKKRGNCQRRSSTTMRQKVPAAAESMTMTKRQCPSTIETRRNSSKSAPSSNLCHSSQPIVCDNGNSNPLNVSLRKRKQLLVSTGDERKEKCAS